jgi:hypothetical protein
MRIMVGNSVTASTLYIPDIVGSSCTPERCRVVGMKAHNKKAYTV